MKSSVLPPNLLRCLSAADRQSLGKGGLLPEEALRKMEIKNEASLQKQIVGLLRLKGIEPIVSRTDRRTSNNLGTPDILFAVVIVYGGSLVHWPCAWEIKMPKGNLSKEQAQMQCKLSRYPNGWAVRVIRSVDQALAELKEMGIAPETTLSPTAENAVASATS